MYEAARGVSAGGEGGLTDNGASVAMYSCSCLQRAISDKGKAEQWTFCKRGISCCLYTLHRAIESPKGRMSSTPPEGYVVPPTHINNRVSTACRHRCTPAARRPSSV